MTARVSVIIAVRNDPAGLEQTLQALDAQTVPSEDVEIVVVDDASTDETTQVTAAQGRAKVLHQSAMRGSYAARNRGIRETAGFHLAITDAGCVPAPDWLERGLARLEEGDAVVAGQIAMPLGDGPSLAAMVDVVHHLDQQRYVEERGCAVTANLMTTRAVVARVGLFDDQLLSSGDFEWTTRARCAGVPLLYASDVIVTHSPRDSAGELFRKSVRVARGGSDARARGTSSSNAQRPYLQPRSVFVPRHRERGRERLAANGASPSRLRWLLVGVAQLALVQLPQAAAALSFDVRRALSRKEPTRRY